MANRPQASNLIKTAFKASLTDETIPQRSWQYDVYFDYESKEYVFWDFPTTGGRFTVSLIEPGPAKVTIDGTTYQITIYEV